MWTHGYRAHHETRVKHMILGAGSTRIMTAVAQKKALVQARGASGSFQRRRLRLIQAKKRSTTHLRGCTAKPTCPDGLRTISTVMIVALAGASPA